VARLLRPQGRRGELLAEPLTDLSEIFTKDRQFRLAVQPEAAPTAPVVTLEDCWRPQGRNAGRLVLKLAGTDSISAAEALEGKELFLPEDQLPTLDQDTYLVRDLVGCTLFDGNTALGTITGLEFPVGSDGRTRLPDAPDLLLVTPRGAPGDTDPVLVPFVKAWLAEVSLSEKRLTMHVPPGLFSDEADGTEEP
jgi:16S rRNA processing protein RimM